MVLKVKKSKDKRAFEKRVAYLKAILIQESINQLEVNQKIKNRIKKEVIKELLKS